MRPSLSLAGSLLALALAVAPVGCKRTQTPQVEEVWSEAPEVGDAEALAALAPPWPKPQREVLDNGLITFWLHEPGAPVVHLRLMLPVGDDQALRSAAIVSVLHAHLVQTLGTRGRGRGLVVEAEHAPDRVEVVMHGAVEDTERVLQVMASVLGARAPAAGLEAARHDVLGRLQAPVTPDERATAGLVEQLLGRPPGSQRAARAAVEKASREDLLAAWEVLVDPRRAVLVVHAGQDAARHRASRQTLAERWSGKGRRKAPPSALARLRAGPELPSSQGRLLAEPTPAATVVPGPEGKPVLMLGRVVPTPSAEDRSLARLAQRLLQEEVDARLVVRGDTSLFLVRVPLSSRDPAGSVTEAIDALSELAATRQPAQRLFEAAQLWLGGRVVQASLDGEDWTALWSDAMDLSSRDADITRALADDAGGMLEPDPEALQAWLGRWLDPRRGEPGWQWVVAGASKSELRRLSRVVPIHEPSS